MIKYIERDKKICRSNLNIDPFSNQEPFVVYQQDSSYRFLNIGVVDQENVLIGKYYDNDGDVLDEFKIST